MAAGTRIAGYVNRVVRQPARISLHDAIPEGDDEGLEDRQVPLQTQGAMSDASKRQR